MELKQTLCSGHTESEEDGAVVLGQRSPLHLLLVVPAPLLGRRWAQDSSGAFARTQAGPHVLGRV